MVVTGILLMVMAMEAAITGHHQTNLTDRTTGRNRNTLSRGRQGILVAPNPDQPPDRRQDAADKWYCRFLACAVDRGIVSQPSLIARINGRLFVVLAGKAALKHCHSRILGYTASLTRGTPGLLQGKGCDPQLSAHFWAYLIRCRSKFKQIFRSCYASYPQMGRTCIGWVLQAQDASQGWTGVLRKGFYNIQQRRMAATCNPIRQTR